MKPTVGVLALQGAFGLHAVALTDLGARAREVRTPHDLARVDALVMPGGESTTMSMLLESSGLFDAIAERLDDGMPVFGTCAGMILLATTCSTAVPTSARSAPSTSPCAATPTAARSTASRPAWR